MGEDTKEMIKDMQDHIIALEKLNYFLLDTIKKLKEMRDKDPMLNKHERANIDSGLIGYLLRIIEYNEDRIKSLRMNIWRLRAEEGGDQDV
jgi:hypothetical protein